MRQLILGYVEPAIFVYLAVSAAATRFQTRRTDRPPTILDAAAGVILACTAIPRAVARGATRHPRYAVTLGIVSAIGLLPMYVAVPGARSGETLVAVLAAYGALLLIVLLVWRSDK